MKRLLKWGGAAIFLSAFAFLCLMVINLGPGNFGRMVLGVGRSYDHHAPVIEKMSEPAVLVFSKTNGYRDDPQILAANAAIEKIVRDRGWSVHTTENAGVFNSVQLAKFKAVVWNSVSGDVLTPRQRTAFRSWIEQGGGFVALHGSGGDMTYDWQWYVDELIGAQFIGHTFEPQFQKARLVVEDRNHPATRHLPETWARVDEWYSFASNPRQKGSRVLISIDEKSYSPTMAIPLSGAKDLRMGDHPMVWTHCIGKGRSFYSALGHQASAYSEAAHLRMIDGAIAWAVGTEPAPCNAAENAR